MAWTGVHTRSMKIYGTRAPRIRAPPWHGDADCRFCR